MNSTRSQRRAAKAAAAAASINNSQSVAGAEFLLSMVETHWAGNGNGGKMESGLRAQQELEKIEQQIAHLESAPGQDAHTRREIHRLHERVNALRREISAHLGAWEKTELARHPQRPYTLDYIERIFTDWSEIHGDRGFADDPAIVCSRERQKRNFLATLLLSQGVPMLLGGDEIGRTQRGNNNAYCQDNEISWYDWNLDERRTHLLEFTKRVIELRRSHPNFRRRKFYQDRVIHHSVEKDIAWYTAEGREMTEEEWSAGWARSLAVMFNGHTLNIIDDSGHRVTDDTFLIVLNSSDQNVRYTLPAPPNNSGWEFVLNTAQDKDPFQSGNAEQELEVAARSVVALRDRKPK